MNVSYLTNITASVVSGGLLPPGDPQSYTVLARTCPGWVLVGVREGFSRKRYSSWVSWDGSRGVWNGSLGRGMVGVAGAEEPRAASAQTGAVCRSCQPTQRLSRAGLCAWPLV